tara:strand:+ start:67 stop:309 length:243 start_codon:yes stop_codon:yes gene_type:complete
MKTLTFKRGTGWRSVVQFDNGSSFAVSVKGYKTQKGAEAANQKLHELCGENWEHNNMLWNVTKDDGEIVELYRRENRISI